MMRNHTLDALRGVAAILVVVDHTLIRANVPRPIDLGALGVCIFFVISGYILPQSLPRYPTVAAFLAARVRRLWPPYLAGLAVAALLQPYAPPNWAAAPLDGLGVVTNVLMLPSIAAASRILPIVWTLELEWLFYALLALLWRAHALRAAPALAILAALVAYALHSLPIAGLALFLCGVALHRAPLPSVQTPLAGVGRISYSLYLVHLPLLWLSPWLALLTLPAAWLFWRVIERR